MSLVDRIFGKPLASWQSEDQKIGVWAGLPVLGLDGLSSAAYGQKRWYEYFLHNHRAEVLKALLLLQDHERIIIVNIPWYMR